MGIEATRRAVSTRYRARCRTRACPLSSALEDHRYRLVGTYRLISLERSNGQLQGMADQVGPHQRLPRSFESSRLTFTPHFCPRRIIFPIHPWPSISPGIPRRISASLLNRAQCRQTTPSTSINGSCQWRRIYQLLYRS